MKTLEKRMVYRRVLLHPNKQNKVKILQLAKLQIRKRKGLRCGFGNTSDKGKFRFRHVRIKRDPPVLCPAGKNIRGAFWLQTDDNDDAVGAEPVEHEGAGLVHRQGQAGLPHLRCRSPVRRKFFVGKKCIALSVANVVELFVDFRMLQTSKTWLIQSQ